MSLFSETTSLDEIQILTRSSLDNTAILKEASVAAAISKYLGTIKNNELLDDINKWRQVFSFSSFYGHRLGKNISVVGDLRTEGFDLFCTDNEGVLKNSVTDQSAHERVINAKNRKRPIVALFGGSTMMGQGSRLPDFTIPSLVEKILEKKFNLKSTCINFGVGAWMCSDSLHLLIHEVLPLKPDIVIFYDGWNCCSHLTQNEKIRMYKRSLGRFPLPFIGTQTRHMENDITLSTQYDWLSLAIRAIKLAINNCFVIASSLITFSLFKRGANSIIRRFFSPRASNVFQQLISKITLTNDQIELLCKKASLEYARIQNIAASICKINDIKFINAFQPLVFFGKKKLTSNETEWRENGFSSGDPRLFHGFYLEVSQLANLNTARPYFYDLTDVFDHIDDEVYIDSGHLNRYGNYLVAERLAEVIQESLDN